MHMLQSGEEVDKPLPPSEWMHPALAVNVEEVTTRDDDEEPFYSVYTDGSDLGSGKVGCAFVVYKRGNVQPIYHQKFRLAGACTINQAEVLALLEATGWVRRQKLDVRSRGAIVYTDSKVALAMMADPRNHLQNIEEIRGLIRYLREAGWNIRLEWTRAHVGTAGNEEADRLAKEAASDSDMPEAIGRTSKGRLKSMLSAESVDHWEQAWQATDDGNHTRSIFPTIADRMRTSFPFSWRMTMLLSGHGRLRAYLHRFYLAETDFCSCGSGDVQDWSHVLYDCSHFVVPGIRLGHAGSNRQDVKGPTQKHA